MIKIYYPDGDWCYRPLHTVHAVFHSTEGTLTARFQKADGSFYELEITGFEMIAPGQIFT